LNVGWVERFRKFDGLNVGWFECLNGLESLENIVFIEGYNFDFKLPHIHNS